MRSLNQLPQWHALFTHYQKNASCWHKAASDLTPQRIEQFSFEVAGMSLDCSKNFMTKETVSMLIELAEACDLPAKINALISGECVNTTENLPALHTALRFQGAHAEFSHHQDILPKIKLSWQKMADLSQRLQQKKLCGFSGEPIQDIIHIGVGGSDLGPRLLLEALEPYNKKHVNTHFITHINQLQTEKYLDKLSPASTMIIVASKSFTSQETLINAQYFKDWLMAAGGQAALDSQLIAVTASAERARQFGVAEDNIFPLWPWVGGRFSVWSCVSLIVVLAIGIDAFHEFLAGAQAMDDHFRMTPLPRNIPVILALISIWYINFLHFPTRAIIPYDPTLSSLIPYLQQLHMESLGKNIQSNGQKVEWETGAIIWGGVATEYQHSFYQMLLQGTQTIPIDFILPLTQADNEHQQYFTTNYMAQSQALSQGIDAEKLCQLYADEKQTPHQLVFGKQPMTTVYLNALTPYDLGSLLALYEHKVFVQSVIWHINAFDQWGVESSKKLVGSIQKKYPDNLK